MATIKKSSHKNATRSRLLIKTAFAELLNEKDLSKITVTDIVERANISRGTFYAHYLDVYDLHAAIQTNIIEAIDNLIEAYGVKEIIFDPSEIIMRSLLFLEKSKDYYRLFVTSSSGEILQNRIVAKLEDIFTAELREMITAEDFDDISCHLHFVLGGIQTVTVRWLEGNLPVSAQTVANNISAAYANLKPENIKRLAEENEQTDNPVADTE